LLRSAAPATCAAIASGSRLFEQREPSSLPASDVLAGLQRGMIVPADDLGLRPAQRRAFRYDAYNGGCLGVQGCVADADAAGYACSAGQMKRSPQLAEAYAFLNAPLAPDDFEHRLPPYLARTPPFGPNSVGGLSLDGRKQWQADVARTRGAVPQGCFEEA
jgi:hypothetical protein